jgi:DNA polymerase III subunit gamma/tau
VSLALYRRYRPETFAEVIGQEHVTEPLQQAIRNDRVHHAYLFSGPRGCGKTTSARLLARCLNCEKGPTPEPCGVCQSCQDLSRAGAGSVDVVEIDAASHGGVDDARDLRERAFFAPAVSRYKIYIVDEAHMVTTAGFNALLKVVEEPPPHLKFVFATTEPDKVIPTIRSRTHHYPFRLVPPKVMRDYLGQLCEREGVAVEPAVLPLVVRAGAGSVRDALSVLDQLLAGSGESGVTYALAVSLLGFTDAQLLDDVVDAFAAGDGAGVFRVVERVIEGGHDPRRFAQDLLERLRDLVILSAVPDVESSGLIDAPADQLERMRQEADHLGSAELTRAADIINAGLTEMRGATAPRLQLELICARILLPGADQDERGLHARIDRLERVLALGSKPGQAPAAGAAPTSSAVRAPETPRSPRPTPDAGPKRAAQADPRAGSEDSATAPQVRTDVSEATVPAGLDLAGVRRMWPDILEVVKVKRRFTWLVLLDHVQVVGLSDGVLTVAFANEGQRRNFTSGGSDEVLREAVYEVLGADWRIEAVHDPGRAAPSGSESPGPAARRGRPGRSGSIGTAGPVTSPPGVAAGSSTDSDSPGTSGEPGAGNPNGVADSSPRAASRDASSEGGPATSADRTGGPGGGSTESRTSAAAASQRVPAGAASATLGEVQPVPTQRADAKSESDQTLESRGNSRDNKTLRDGGKTGVARRSVQDQDRVQAGGAVHDPDAQAHPDDEDLVGGGLAGAELLAKELGATLIDEVDRQD